MSVGLFALIVLFRVLVYSYFVMTYSDCTVMYNSKRGVTVWGVVAAVGEAKVLEGGWVDPPPPPTRER